MNSRGICGGEVVMSTPGPASNTSERRPGFEGVIVAVEQFPVISGEKCQFRFFARLEGFLKSWMGRYHGSEQAFIRNTILSFL